MNPSYTLEMKSRVKAESRVTPFHCIDPACTHLFGASTARELRLGESAIIRSRANLTCPKCGRRRLWRPLENRK